jgi:hypothetical protein
MKSKIVYKQIKETVEKSIVRWEWAKEMAYGSLPFEIERKGQIPATTSGYEPKVRKNFYQYGFNKDNELVVIRDFQSISEQCFETFIIVGKTETVSYYFSYDRPKKLLAETFQTIENNHVISSITTNPYGVEKKEQYFYENNLLTKIHFQQSGKTSNMNFAHSFDINYDNAQVSEIVWNERNDRKTVVYSLKSDNIAFVQTNLLEKTLIDLIFEKIKNLKLEETAYCVVLSYTQDLNYSLPPILGIGLEKERCNIIKSGARSEIWNPEEFSLFGVPELSLKNIQTNDLFANFNLFIAKQNDLKSLKSLLLSVSKKLNQVNWSSIIPVTKDFLVYSVDDELSDLQESLADLPLK